MFAYLQLCAKSTLDPVWASSLLCCCVCHVLRTGLLMTAMTVVTFIVSYRIRLYGFVGSIESRCVCQRKAESNYNGGDSGGAELRRVRSEMSGGTRGGARTTQYMSCPRHCWGLPPSANQISTSRTPRSRGVNSSVLVEPVRINPGAFITRGAAQLAHGCHSQHPLAHTFTRFRCPRTTMSNAVPLGRFAGCGVR